MSASLDTNATSLESAIARSAELALERVAAARSAIGSVIFGQERVVEEVLVTLMAGGHGLLVGVPGLAKTKLVDTLGTVLGLDARRVQFPPDLMPADILGSEIMEEGENGRRAFRFVRGPIFAQLLMADEINRAPAKTQAALLEVMQEAQVTIDGAAHPIAQPFMVLATQNPVEQEGTYPLPEAQLDRLLVGGNPVVDGDGHGPVLLHRHVGRLLDLAVLVFAPGGRELVHRHRVEVVARQVVRIPVAVGVDAAHQRGPPAADEGLHVRGNEEEREADADLRFHANVLAVRRPPVDGTFLYWGLIPAFFTSTS